MIRANPTPPADFPLLGGGSSTAVPTSHLCWVLRALIIPEWLVRDWREEQCRRIAFLLRFVREFDQHNLPWKQSGSPRRAIAKSILLFAAR
jgi:hypothetical protein